MRLLTTMIALGFCTLLVPPLPAEQPALETDEQKTLYALGIAISRSLRPFELTEKEFVHVEAGFADGTLGRDSRVVLETFGPKVDAMLLVRVAAITEREKQAGQALLSKSAEEPGAVKTDLGFVYREIEAGQGASPLATDTVTLHYHGTLRDGTVFDSSVVKGVPTTFALGGVIPCFRDGIQKMKVGGKSKLTCSPEAAYGDRGAPPVILPGATIVFEVELLEIAAAADATPAESQKVVP